MFSYFGKITNGMAFTPSPERYSRRYALEHAEKVLAAYLDGREKPYAVLDVIRELRALFHAGAEMPAALLARAIETPADDETTRLQLVTAALEMIGKQVRGDRGG